MGISCANVRTGLYPCQVKIGELVHKSQNQYEIMGTTKLSDQTHTEWKTQKFFLFLCKTLA